jgi:glutaminyl-tRNA synthetase
VFEHAIREDLNRRALRRLAVLRPLKVVLTNYPEGKTEEVDAVNNPENPAAGTRKIPLSRVIYIEQDDFQEVPPPKYFRLKPGGEVRLKYAYIIRCEEVVKDDAGRIVELRCAVDFSSRSAAANSARPPESSGPDTSSGGGPSAPAAGRKVKGTIHWVSAEHAIEAEIRLYDRLFTAPDPDAEGDFRKFLNPHSLEVVTAKCEPSLREARLDMRYQFERLAYFTLDTDSQPAAPNPRLVFNRTITLKDTWAKESRKP